VRDFHLRPDTTNIKKAHQDFCESLLFMGKNVSHLAVTKQILLNRINFNVCMNDKFLGTFFNFFILLQAMTKLYVYLTKYEQTGFKSNYHTTACCMNL